MARKSKTTKLNLWDHYDKVRLAAQCIAMIASSLHLKEPATEDSAFDDIMKLADNGDGEFILKDFDGFNFRSSGPIRVQFEWSDDQNNIEPTILLELA
jgi:signal transduction histidine kinase